MIYGARTIFFSETQRRSLASLWIRLDCTHHNKQQHGKKADNGEAGRVRRDAGGDAREEDAFVGSPE